MTEEINLPKLKAKEMIESVLPYVNEYTTDLKEGVAFEQAGQKLGRAKQICLLTAFEMSSAVERITPKVKGLDEGSYLERCKAEQEFIELLKEEISNYK